MAELGLIPKEAAKVIWDKGAKAEFDTPRIDAIEREVKHDVIAFLTHLPSTWGPKPASSTWGSPLRCSGHLLQRPVRAGRGPPARRS